MRYLPTASWMQEADRETILEYGIPSMVLMERAALQTLAVMKERSLNLSHTLIVCGSGNNGGDGFALARLLLECGHRVTVFFVGNFSSMTTECKHQYEIAKKCKVHMVTTTEPEEYTTIVDAIFGVGLSRQITGVYADVIDGLNAYDADKVAIDIPSGVCATTGAVLGTAFRADVTVTFAYEKLGLCFFPGAEYAGDIKVVPIGIWRKPTKESCDVCYTLERKDLVDYLPPRKANSHKGTYGRILMITGSKGMSGAAYLSAKAAYASGAGLVWIYTEESNRAILQQLLPEAIVYGYNQPSTSLTQLQTWMSQATTICIGCGLGRSDQASQLVEYVLTHATVPCVVDADALFVLGNHPALLRKARVPVILTPHMKEMAQLLSCSVEKVQSHRMECIQHWTQDVKVVCVLKDARTYVMQQGHAPFLNTAGNQAMAKAGSGDVLAGVISALLAQGALPYEAAVAGVLLHACAGDVARSEKGSYSVFAQDLISGIGSCLKETEENKGK
jgi:NAD(P)H-hydrate epimerase